MRRCLVLVQLWLVSHAARIIVGDDHDDQKPVIVYEGSSNHNSNEKTAAVPSSANLNDLIDSEGGADDDDAATSGEARTERHPSNTGSSPIPTSTQTPLRDGSAVGSAIDVATETQTSSTTEAIQQVTEDSTTSPSIQSYVNYTTTEYSTSSEAFSYSTELPPDSQHREPGTDSVTGMHTESSGEAPHATSETNDPTTTIRWESYTTSPESTAQTSSSPSESSTRSTSVTPGETTGTTMKTYATVSKSTTKAPTKTALNPDEIIVYLPLNRTDQAADPSHRNQGRRVAPSRTVVVLHCVPAYIVSRRQYDGYLERTAALAGLRKKTFNNIRGTFRKFARDRASIRSGPPRVRETDRLQTYQNIKQHSLSQCKPSERANVALFFQKLEENHNNTLETTDGVAGRKAWPLSPATHERLIEFLKSKRALTVDGTIVNRQEWPQVKREAFRTVIPTNETTNAEAFFKRLEFRRPSYRQLICKTAVGKFATQTSIQRLHSGLLELYRKTKLPSANFETFMKLCKVKAPIYQSIVEENIDVVNRTIKLIDVYARIKLLTWTSTPSNERNALLQFFADAERYVITSYGSWLLDNAQNAASLKWSVYRYAFDLVELAGTKFNSSEHSQLNRLLMSENTCLGRLRLPVSIAELGNEMANYNCYWNKITSVISKTFSYRAELSVFLEKLRRLVFFRNNYKNFLT